MRNVIINIIFIILFVGCFRGKIDREDIDIDDYEAGSKTSISQENKIKLYIPRDKLEILFGKEFVPIYNKFVNLDSDADEEYIIAFKKKNSDTIDIFVFDIVQTDVIRKKYSIETMISNSENLSIQSQNLLFQNDICIIIEGVSSDNKNLLYIITYNNEKYEILNIFSGDFSTFINYDEIENDKGKYNVLKDVTVINNSFSSTNVNIKKREVYKWDYERSDFYLVESTDILSEDNQSIDYSIYSSEEKYYEFIKGFWYPSEYKAIIEKDLIGIQNFDVKNIEFINFSDNPKEISIKYGDYIEKYSLIKISKIWGQKPGLRFTMNESSNPNNKFLKHLDIYLLSPTSLKTNGPNRYAQDLYVRLQKPFIEYIYDKNQNHNTQKNLDISNFLIGEFKNIENTITILFFEGDNFEIQKNNKKESGVYKINYNNNLSLISFVFENKFKMLDDKNFILNINSDKLFSLTPIKLSITGFTIDNVTAIDFEKIEQ